MDNSKSMKFNLNKLLLKAISLVVIGAFLVNTVFVDLVWAEPNSFLRPCPAREDANVLKRLFSDIDEISSGFEQGDKGKSFKLGNKQGVFPKVNNTIEEPILRNLVDRALEDSYLDFVMQKLSGSISIIQVAESGLLEEAAGFAGNDPKNKIVFLFIPSSHTAIPRKEMVIRIEHEMEHIYAHLKYPKIYQTFEDLYKEIRSRSMSMKAEQYFQMLISQFGDFHLRWNQVKENREEYAVNESEDVFRNVENFLKKKCEGSKKKLTGKVVALYVTAKILTVIMPFETQKIESPAKKRLLDIFNEYVAKKLIERGMEEARNIADEFLKEGYPDFQRLIEIDEQINKIGKTEATDMLPSKETGTPATLLAYMYKEGIFGNNFKKVKEMTGQRGGNDSPTTIYRELKVLKTVGLVETVKALNDGRISTYYLSEWLRDMNPEDIIKENPELKSANPNDEQIKAVAARVKAARFKALKEAGDSISLKTDVDKSVSLPLFLTEINYWIMTKTNEGKSLAEIGEELKMSAPTVHIHSWKIIAELEGKKWSGTKIRRNFDQVKEDMGKGIKNLDEVSRFFCALLDKSKEEVNGVIREFWREKRNRGQKMIRALIKAREIEVVSEKFRNSIIRLRKTEKLSRQYSHNLSLLQNAAAAYKFSTPKSLILYSEPLLENFAIGDLEETLGIFLKNNVLGEVILYAEDPVYNEILGEIIKDIEPGLNITMKTKEELGLKQGDSEVNEVEAVIGEKKNILCVIKGTVEAQSQAQLRDFSRDRNIPIVVFKGADGKHIYSLADALQSAITAREMFIDLPPVETGDIEEEYKEYRESLRELSGA